MRFATQWFERLVLALGAAVGITLLATVARSHGEPMLEVHREAAALGQQAPTHFQNFWNKNQPLPAPQAETTAARFGSHLRRHNATTTMSPVGDLSGGVRVKDTGLVSPLLRPLRTNHATDFDAERRNTIETGFLRRRNKIHGNVYPPSEPVLYQQQTNGQRAAQPGERPF
jgi:hypothetical protein